eukprot:Nitzschia sp. Nitz4//scaffold19_size178191//175277//175917//NITZ4_002018-RA/size178191-augustus-gene-0.90-mRNA-1//1//CDS//3329540804//5099//frame0
MSGLGRRSHYRKHLTDTVLHGLPEPGPEEQIARVVATRGGNQFDICVPNDDTQYLALLPTKFHKLVWVKRGDYVIVHVGDANEEGEDETTEAASGIRHMITHILYKDQVKHLQNKGLWPEDDPSFASGTMEDNPVEEADDGIVYNDDDNDDDLFVNTNRVARMEIQDSSDSSEEEEEDDD